MICSWTNLEDILLVVLLIGQISFIDYFLTNPLFMLCYNSIPVDLPIPFKVTSLAVAHGVLIEIESVNINTVLMKQGLIEMLIISSLPAWHCQNTICANGGTLQPSLIDVNQWIEFDWIHKKNLMEILHGNILFGMLATVGKLGFTSTSKEYCKVSNIRHTLVGNDIVDHSDVVGVSPVGAVPTTSSCST